MAVRSISGRVGEAGGAAGLRRRASGRAALGRAGYTLTELSIVVAILGSLLSVAAPAYKKSRKSAQVTACMKNMRVIEAAKQQWAFTHGGTPTWEGLADYLPRRRPECPSGGEYEGLELGQGVYCTVHDWRTDSDDEEPAFAELKDFSP